MIYSLPAACSDVRDMFLVLPPQALRVVPCIYKPLHGPLILLTSPM
jgi:hypothetical protein